jgi:phospholipase C
MPESISRRTFVRRAGVVGAASLAAPTLLSQAARAGTARRFARSSGSTPIRHIVISCQENRSFDHYYGYAPWAGEYGPPDGYFQPDGNGGKVYPYHFKHLSTPDIDHSWLGTHAEHDHGLMDGFYTNDGKWCMGYYTARELPFYYSLFDTSTLCVNYFCSVMGPTWPNRFYLASGTSGGITTNGVWGYGVFDYPIILDLLEDAGISWKVYNIGWDNVTQGDSDNVFVFWKRWARDPRTRGKEHDYYRDLEGGTLPSVSFIIPSYLKQRDEHPPADVQVGMHIQQKLIRHLRQSSAWDSAAFVLTYDEAGGYFDHVPPAQLDAYGLGIRVPTWVVSPYAKRGHLEPRLYDHTSTLKFIERVFDLPTLASVNHRFDQRTPGGPNNEAANGRPHGPPAPPRDGYSVLGDLMDCFDF